MTRKIYRLRNQACLLAMACAFLAVGCLESKCYKDADCPSGTFCDPTGKCVDKCRQDGDCPGDKRCVTSTGRCVLPECEADGECAVEQRCIDFVCEPWCDTDEDCLAGKKCYSNKCVPLSADCNCPLAPEVCAEDINQQSSSEGFSVCIPDTFEGGVLLFFGSVFCSHCRHMFETIREYQAELVTEGHDVRAIFMQIRQYEAGNDDVAQLLDGFTDPVIHDTEELDIWGRYDADWYHVILVDPYGCLSYHVGPLSQATMEEGAGAEIKQRWKETLHAECLDPVEPVPDSDDLMGFSDVVEIADVPVVDIPDLQVDTAPSEDIVTDVGFDLQAPDLPDVVPEEVDVGPETDTGPAPDTGEPVVPVCQIAGGAPIEPGDKVPDFTCEDINPTSETGGQAVTSDDLMGVVWLAYYGSCT